MLCATYSFDIQYDILRKEVDMFDKKFKTGLPLMSFCVLPFTHALY